MKGSHLFSPNHIRSVVLELIDEDVFVLRALLRVTEIVCTDKVPTAAVTRGAQPRLLINDDFVRKHCRSEVHLQSIIVHECLHVVLGHVRPGAPVSVLENIAMDAVINASILRTLGNAYGEFFALYYAEAEGVMRLLRPMTAKEATRCGTRPRDPLDAAWRALYEGKLNADDLCEIASLFESRTPLRKIAPDALLGSHPAEGEEADEEGALSDPLSDAIDETLRRMNGSGLFRYDHRPGVYANAAALEIDASALALNRWKRNTRRILERYLLPDGRGIPTYAPRESFLPVLNAGDRRAWMKAGWSPFLPEVCWPDSVPQAQGRAQVYLDASGSMFHELPHIIALLHGLRDWIRLPFWAFSNAVAPASISNGELVTESTGGTSFNCVLEHVADTRPAAAVIVTDGFIEPIDSRLLQRCSGTRLHVIVSRDGDRGPFVGSGIPSTQLEALPA